MTNLVDVFDSVCGVTLFLNKMSFVVPTESWMGWARRTDEARLERALKLSRTSVFSIFEAWEQSE